MVEINRELFFFLAILGLGAFVACRLSLVAASRSHSSTRASRCGGFSGCRAQTLECMNFSSRGTQG